MTLADPPAKAKILRGHEHFITSLDFSPDGRWLASVDADNTALVWDMSAKEPTAEPHTLGGKKYATSCLAWSADGRSLITGSPDSSVCVWQNGWQFLVQIGKARVGRSFTNAERARYLLEAAHANPQRTSTDGVASARQEWFSLRSLVPAPASWHDAQARACEASAHEFGARFHRLQASHLRQPPGETQESNE
jgi:hypothetical protein